MNQAKEVKKFDAEVGKVLNLVINSIYTNKDIFLRELISNASDACDKLKYESLTNPESQEFNSDFKITIKIDQPNKTVVISDNGIGMNYDDLVTNLGTIANSGTQKFIDNLSANNNSSTDINLIGQFGVGFYSAFMVADSVTVLTKKCSENKSYKWHSEGKGEYTIEETDEHTSNGTTIMLHLKDSETEYLEKYRIKHIISTYSDHIAFPIELLEEDDKKELLNKASALWIRNSSDITEKEYEEFFHHVSYFPGKPWLTLHNKVEGTLQYTNLLFIPDSKPFDLYHPDRKTKVKLYINRVFISEEGNDLIPAYLRFLRGIVDSEDLPLNISRETLQHNAVLRKIKKSIVNKVLSTLKEKLTSDPKNYDAFWSNFGEVIKEGLCEHTLDEKNQILEICKFQTTTNPNAVQLITLDEYISHMTEEQKDIYYLSGDNIDSLQNNPQLEGFKKRNIPVILLQDHVDNFWVNVINEYKGKKLTSISSSNIDLNKIKKLDDDSTIKKNESNEDEHKKLIEFIKETLKDKIKDVSISSKLINSPACISVPEGSMNIRMEKFLMEQKQLKNKSLKILEINPKHPILTKVENSLSDAQEIDRNKDIIYVIYTQACLIEGETIENPSEFGTKLNSLLAKGLV